MPENSADVLILDMDPVSGPLMRRLLGEAGLHAVLETAPDRLLELVKQHQPRLVVMDISFPEVNGLDLLRALKTGPETGATRVVVVTEKAYEFEKTHAFKYGAAAFIAKPFNTSTFAGQVRQVLAGASRDSADLCKRKEVKKLYTRPETDLRDGEARLTFWGCRGLGAVLPNEASAFGRQTPCVSVETPTSVFIFDGGTGIVPLGEKLLRQGGPKNVWIVLSHMHISHVAGLPHFACLNDPEYKISFAGACGGEKKLRQVAEELFYGSAYWTARRPKAEISLFEMAEDSGEVAPGVLLSAMGANHPSECLALKIELCGKKIVYAPDSELKPDPYALESYNERLAGFAQGADVLIHDSYYMDQDYPANAGKGHSAVGAAVELAAQADVKNLVLFHASTVYDDNALRQMLAQAKDMVSDNKWNFNCLMARDGLTISYRAAQQG